MTNNNAPAELKNPKRRLLLTFGITGAVAFVLGKLFDSFSSNDVAMFHGAPVVRQTKFTNFTLTETNGEIVLQDKDGEEIFIVEKGN